MGCASCISKKQAAKFQCIGCGEWRELRFRKNETLRFAMSKRSVSCPNCKSNHFDLNNAVEIPV